MRNEAVRNARQQKAERIHAKVAHLHGLAQSETLGELLNEIQDEESRHVVEHMVWYWLNEGRPASNFLKQHLTEEKILLATFLIVCALGYFQIGIPILWSITAAFILTFLLRLFFRMFDRGFLFRRLFAATTSCGLFLIAPATYSFEFETPLGPISYGGAPAASLILVWSMTFICTFGAAVWEHIVSKRT